MLLVRAPMVTRERVLYLLISCSFAQASHLAQFSFSSASASSKEPVTPAMRITSDPVCCTPLIAQSHCVVLVNSRL